MADSKRGDRGRKKGPDSGQGKVKWDIVCCVDEQERVKAAAAVIRTQEGWEDEREGEKKGRCYSVLETVYESLLVVSVRMGSVWILLVRPASNCTITVPSTS